MEPMKLKYLERMSELYPTIAKASTEIINLQAIISRISTGNMRPFLMC